MRSRRASFNGWYNFTYRSPARGVNTQQTTEMAKPKDTPFTESGKERMYTSETRLAKQIEMNGRWRQSKLGGDAGLGGGANQSRQSRLTIGPEEQRLYPGPLRRLSRPTAEVVAVSARNSGNRHKRSTSSTRLLQLYCTGTGHTVAGPLKNPRHAGGSNGHR